MEEKIRAVHVTSFLFAYTQHLTGHCISPLVENLQMGLKTHLFYHFSCVFLNKYVQQLEPKYSMRFVKALHFLLDCIIEADSEILVWVKLTNIQFVAFLLPR